MNLIWRKSPLSPKINQVGLYGQITENKSSYDQDHRETQEFNMHACEDSDVGYKILVWIG